MEMQSVGNANDATGCKPQTWKMSKSPLSFAQEQLKARNMRIAIAKADKIF